jgi:hypothetical protein
MNIPHYELAPITGRNLKELMECYYSEYKPSPLAVFNATSERLNNHLQKHPEHSDYTMNKMEWLCEESKPYVLEATKTGQLLVSQSQVLQAILMTNIPTFSININGSEYIENRDVLKRLLPKI